MNKPYRGLDKLHPLFRKKVEEFLKDVNHNKEIIFITETFRSEERQKELIKSGASKVKVSNHQLGLAIDIGFRGKKLYPSDLNIWIKVANIAKKYHIDWGYDLWKWDKPHFQNNITDLKKIKPMKISTRAQNAMDRGIGNENGIFEKADKNTVLALINDAVDIAKKEMMEDLRNKLLK